MCGILGAFGRRNIVTEELVSSCLDLLSHRGPDGCGRRHMSPVDYPERVLRLGHQRLAILDLSEHGSQPMTDPETGNCIVYNGEVYNYKKLRHSLAQEGVTFESDTDTEVILKYYGRRGLPALLSNLIGMFAFGIWDASSQRLILARDHTGIKPLYYHHGDRVFLFASEVRALLATDLIPRDLDPIALESYLAYGSVQGPHTIVQHIRSLPPAHYLVVEANGTCGSPKSYWAPPFTPEAQANRLDGALVRNFRGLLEEVVTEHMASDVPLGAFLSGGIDSSSVVALMNHVAPGRVQSFSIIFNERSYSEDRYSRLIAQHVGTSHHEICLDERTLLDSLPDTLTALDQPSGDGPNVYAISRAVRAAGITVALSGQGGDEVLCGYPSFRRLSKLSKLQPMLRLTPDWLLRAAAAAGSLFGDYSMKTRKLPDLVRSSKSILSSFLILQQVTLEKDRIRLLPAPDLSVECQFGLPVTVYRELVAATRDRSVVNQISALELATYLPNTLLRDGDSMSMAHSLEIRVPFLDRRVIDFVASVAGPDKLSGSVPKPLLVAAIADLLPREIFGRPKQGFTLPWQRWLRQRLRPTLGAVLDSPDCGSEIGFAPGECQRIWQAFLRGAAIPWFEIWSLFVLIDWCSKHSVTSARGRRPRVTLESLIER